MQPIVVSNLKGVPETMKWRRTLLLMISLLGLLVAACQSPTDRPQDRAAITEITVFNTPGKPLVLFDPGRPAEAITARRDGEQYRLIVKVNAPRLNITAYHEEQTNLTQAEWQVLIDLVIRYRLLDFAPALQPDEVFDFGSRGFAIIGQHQNIQEWTRPIMNGAAPTALMQHLAKLAQVKVPQLPLSYLQPSIRL